MTSPALWPAALGLTMNRKSPGWTDSSLSSYDASSVGAWTNGWIENAFISLCDIAACTWLRCHTFFFYLYHIMKLMMMVMSRKVTLALWFLSRMSFNGYFTNKWTNTSLFGLTWMLLLMVHVAPNMVMIFHNFDIIYQSYIFDMSSAHASCRVVSFNNMSSQRSHTHIK